MSQYFRQKADCSAHEIFPGVTVYTTACREMMLSRAEFEPGAIVEEHSHPHEQVGLMLEGRAHFFIGDENRVLEPGDMFVIPGNVKHRVVALDGPVKALDIFHPIREDYL